MGEKRSNKVGKKITDVGQGTIQKTKNMADVAKLNSVISEEEQKIKSTYEQIGQMLSRNTVRIRNRILRHM